MVFQFNHSDKFEGGLKDGVYEAVISTVKEDVTPGGAQYVDVVLVVRNDIQQTGQNALIFHKIWKAKSTGKYNQKAFNTIGWSAQMDENKQYQSLQDVFDDLQGKPVLVKVKNETSEHNGTTYENLNVKQWNISKFPIVQHQWKAKNENPFQAATPVIEEDDLPF